MKTTMSLLLTSLSRASLDSVVIHRGFIVAAPHHARPAPTPATRGASVRPNIRRAILDNSLSRARKKNAVQKTGYTPKPTNFGIETCNIFGDISIDKYSYKSAAVAQTYAHAANSSVYLYVARSVGLRSTLFHQTKRSKKVLLKSSKKEKFCLRCVLFLQLNQYQLVRVCECVVPTPPCAHTPSRAYLFCSHHICLFFDHCTRLGVYLWVFLSVSGGIVPPTHLKTRAHLHAHVSHMRMHELTHTHIRECNRPPLPCPYPQIACIEPSYLYLRREAPPACETCRADPPEP